MLNFWLWRMLVCHHQKGGNCWNIKCSTIVPKCFDDYKHSKTILIFALESILKQIGTRQSYQGRIQGNRNYSSRDRTRIKSWTQGFTRRDPLSASVGTPKEYWREDMRREPFPKHETRIDDECLIDRRSRWAIYGKFPYKELDQREINQDKSIYIEDVES